MADDPFDARERGVRSAIRLYTKHDVSLIARMKIKKLLTVASTSRLLKRFRDLFSIAPMLKSSTATMLNRSRSYSKPNRSSSHFIARFNDSIAKSQRSMFFASA